MNYRLRPVPQDRCHDVCGGDVSCELDLQCSHHQTEVSLQRQLRLAAEMLAVPVATDWVHRVAVLANLRFVPVVRRVLVIRRDYRRDRHHGLHSVDAWGDALVV